MKTDDLIARLAGQAGGPVQAPMAQLAARAILFGMVISAVVFAVVLGPRPDLAEAARHPVTLAKTVLPLLLGALGVPLAVRAARPGAAPGLAGGIIWLLPVTALALFVWSVATTPSADWMITLRGHSIPVCLPMIVVLSLPVLVFLFRALRQGAPENPGRCGALAGLAAAGFATTLYSLFCNEDAPLFYVVWYGVGIGIVTLAGYQAGKRFLRW